MGFGCFGLGTYEIVGSIKLNKNQKYKIRFELGSVNTSSFFSANTLPFENLGMYQFGADLVTDPEVELLRAVNLAKFADKVMVVVGTNKEVKSKGFDREDIEIPGDISNLITKISEVNDNIVVVNQSESPVTFPWISKVKGLLQAWFGGNELGYAIADVLFSDDNPSGKLSL